MKVYCVTDHDELEEWYPTKKEAARMASKYAADDRALHRESGETTNSLYLIEYEVKAPITREVVCRLLAREGFAKERKVIAQWESGRRVPIREAAS